MQMMHPLSLKLCKDAGNYSALESESSSSDGSPHYKRTTLTSASSVSSTELQEKPGTLGINPQRHRYGISKIISRTSQQMKENSYTLD